MRLLRLTFVVLLLGGVALAADPGAVRRSQAALVGAISGVLGDEFMVQKITQYLPGYGAQFSFYVPFDAPAASEAAGAIAGLLSALGATVQGLDAGDWVSVFVGGQSGFMDPEYQLLVRLKPGEAGSLEIWVNGVKQ